MASKYSWYDLDGNPRTYKEGVIEAECWRDSEPLGSPFRDMQDKEILEEMLGWEVYKMTFKTLTEKYQELLESGRDQFPVSKASEFCRGLKVPALVKYWSKAGVPEDALAKRYKITVQQVREILGTQITLDIK